MATLSQLYYYHNPRSSERLRTKAEDERRVAPTGWVAGGQRDEGSARPCRFPSLFGSTPRNERLAGLRWPHPL